MAKLTFVHNSFGAKQPSEECIEVRPWAQGGRKDQIFCIGSGYNSDAHFNVWIEVRYTVQGAPLFYTRTIIHVFGFGGLAAEEARLQAFIRGELDTYTFGDTLPETRISLKRDRFKSKDQDGQEKENCVYTLTISLDMGAVFGVSYPGERMVDIRLEYLELEDGLNFMRQWVQELDQVMQGRHPDPAHLPPDSSDWPFARQLNRQVYDSLASEHQEHHFEIPCLRRAFDRWISLLPPGGQVLDVGCGHGDPVIARLLAKGFRVTGNDLSPAMLQRAREQFPTAVFVECAATEIDFEETFDGICSFSSVLYLDPIDFFHAIYRLHRALKPEGLLYLYGWERGTDARGDPYGIDLNNWLWSWTYSLNEAAQALEEHGRFKVLEAQDITRKAEKRELLKLWRIQRQREYEEFVKILPPEAHISPPDLNKSLESLSNHYVIVARKQRT
jgi:SAM-dependent methyltransferase